MNQSILVATLTFLAIGLIVGGFVSMILALKHRTAEHPPVPSFNPRDWVSFGKRRQWYSPKGCHLAVWGSLAVSLGAFLAILRRLL